MLDCNQLPKVASFFVFSFLLLWPAACTSGEIRPQLRHFEPASIRISGSDTMLRLNRHWAEAYMKSTPGVAVYCWGGGSGRGVRDLIDSRVQISAVSRPLLAEEVRLLAERHQTVGLAFAVAKEALSIYVHPENPVRDFTLSQLFGIFSGSIRDWRELGGQPAPIRVFRRSSVSGTYSYFLEHVLNGTDYRVDAEVRGNTEDIVNSVSEDRWAIGYGGLAYGEKLHGRVEGIAPLEENVRNGAYPITRYLYLVTLHRPSGAVKDFVDWVQGPEGQAIVREAGYVALW